MRRLLEVAPLALVSSLMLAYEVFLTKLASLTVDALLVYTVIGVALLGGGAAGSVLTLFPASVSAERAPRTFALGSLGFAATLVVTTLAYVRISPMVSVLGLGATLAVAGLLAAPFFAAGVAIAAALASAGEQVGVRYAANLLGSAAGCALPLLLLRPLGGERFVAALGAAALLVAVVALRSAQVPLRGAVLGTAAATGALLGWLLTAPQAAMPVTSEPQGQAAATRQLARARGAQSVELFSRWDPTGHIAVVGFRGVPGHPDPYPYAFYAQDGSNGSLLVRWEGETARDVREGRASSTPVSRLCDETLYGMGWAEPRARALVIGLGGGPDVQCALHHEAGQIDVVEINRTTIDAMTGPFDDYLGGIGRDPRVAYHARDGRSFVRASRGAGYDLIQLSGVDTKSVLSAGSLALSENHLYTVEAFQEYLDALSERGAVVLLRFTEAELLRLLGTAWRALEARGASPALHLAAARNDLVVGVLVSREPLSEAARSALRQRYDFTRRPFRGGVDPFFYELVLSDLSKPPRLVLLGEEALDPTVQRWVGALAARDTKAFEAGYPYKLFPTFDDRPFFFDLFPPGSPTARLTGSVLYGLLASLLVLASVGILGPVALAGAARGAFSTRAALYFTGLGLGFLWIEVWLLHRFGLLLGHQTYAFVAVLAAMLVGSGAGAALGPRLVPELRRRALVGTLGGAALAACWFAASDPLLALAWELSPLPRGVLLVLIASLVGFLLGFPFPAGLGWLHRTRPRAATWCIGVNGFTSVLASASITPIALGAGYMWVLALGIAAYLMAALAALGFVSPGEAAGEVPGAAPREPGEAGAADTSARRGSQ